MKYFAKLFSDGIHEKYPNGFTLVSIGRSPAFLAKYLEFQGEDVKYCPISNSGVYYDKLSPLLIQHYKEYFDRIGLTKEFANTTKKPIICVDYTYMGHTLHKFKELLSSTEIRIKKNVEYYQIDCIAEQIGRDESLDKKYQWLFFR